MASRLSRPESVAHIPSGFEFIRRIDGHDDFINETAWSPNGIYLASSSMDGSVRLWEGPRGELYRRFDHRDGRPLSVAWSPDGMLLAVGAEDWSLTLWDVHGDEAPETHNEHRGEVYSVSWSQDGHFLATGSADHSVGLFIRSEQRFVCLKGHQDAVMSVAWAPDNRTLASGSLDGTIRIWDAHTGEMKDIIKGHQAGVLTVAWSMDGFTLVSGSHDQTIRTWYPDMGQQVSVLQGHTGSVFKVCYSPNGRMVASRASDGTVRLWRCDHWEQVAMLHEPCRVYQGGLTFHLDQPILTTRGENDDVIRLWRISYQKLLDSDRPAVSRYRNTKIVLVGNSGVGKTGLGLTLAGEPFIPTESTHGRQVWSFDSHYTNIGQGRRERRDTLLWDLAGQPGYRMFHRLHLHDVVVALVVFDAHDEVDPFAGVDYWARALDWAAKDYPLVKFLVAARSDRGGVAVSREAVQRVMDRLGFEDFFQTSAKRGEGINSLAQAVRAAIRWDELPFFTTPETFAAIQKGVARFKERGRVLVGKQLITAWFKSQFPNAEKPEQLVDTCVTLLESAGLVRRLSFGDLVLLRPEILDHYSAWMAQEARNQSDGLGFLTETRARTGDFAMDEDLRIVDRAMEQALLPATIQEVVGRSLAVRLDTDEGDMLIFPSEMRRDAPKYESKLTPTFSFLFNGPVSVIYATLTVSLLHSQRFKRRELYRNAASFWADTEISCGYEMTLPDNETESTGCLNIYFEAGAPKRTILLFLRYVNQQLEQLAVKGSVERRRVYLCPVPGCGYEIPRNVVEGRSELGKGTLICPIHERHFPLDDLESQVTWRDPRVGKMQDDISEARARQERVSIVEERRRSGWYHALLLHNPGDEGEALVLIDKLKRDGIACWHGHSAPPDQRESLFKARAVLMLVGANWTGSWATEDYHGLLNAYVKEHERRDKRYRLVPLMLPGAESGPRFRGFLHGKNYIDLRAAGFEDQEELGRLVRAILLR